MTLHLTDYKTAKKEDATGYCKECSKALNRRRINNYTVGVQLQ
jgi:hypothetical protein